MHKQDEIAQDQIGQDQITRDDQSPRRTAWRRTIIGAAMLSLGLLITAGAVASAEQTANNETANNEASDENAKCGLKLSLGNRAEPASSELAEYGGETIEYSGVAVTTFRSADVVGAGAMVDERAHLVVTTGSGNTDAVLAFVQRVVDHPHSTFDEADLVAEFDGIACDLPITTDGDVNLHDLFVGNTKLTFDGDNETCEFESRFGDDGFDWSDIDLGDLDFDFNADDDGFSIAVRSGDQQLSLGCTDR